MIKVIEDKKNEIQYEFKDPMEMVKRAYKVIKENVDKMSEVRYLPHDEIYKSVGMDYPENIQILVDGVYENGVAYRITCFHDEAAGKYDIYTTAELICVKGQVPIFIINDNHNENTVYREALGSRIDGPLFDQKENLFTKASKQKIRELTKTKVLLYIEKSLEDLKREIPRVKLEKEGDIGRKFN